MEAAANWIIFWHKFLISLYIIILSSSDIDRLAALKKKKIFSNDRYLDRLYNNDGRHGFQPSYLHLGVSVCSEPIICYNFD